MIKKITGFISEDSGQVKVDNHIGKISVITGNLPLYMSPALYNFLAHYFELKNENWVFESLKSYKGQRLVDTHCSFDTLFIYFDTLAPRIVGDSNSSLLITLPNGSKRSMMTEEVVSNALELFSKPPI